MRKRFRERGYSRRPMAQAARMRGPRTPCLSGSTGTLCRSWGPADDLNARRIERAEGPAHPLPVAPATGVGQPRQPEARRADTFNPTDKHLFSETIRQARLPIPGAEDNVVEQLLLGTHRAVPFGCVGPAGLGHPGNFGTGASRPRQRIYRPSGPGGSDHDHRLSGSTPSCRGRP